MSVITHCPPQSLWEQICEDFQKERRLLEDDQMSVSTDYTDFDPAKHNPVFFGKMYSQVPSDYDPTLELNASVSHPSCAGYWFADIPPQRSKSVPPSAKPVDWKTCSNREYLEHYVWPCLLQVLERTLVQAKLEGCFKLTRVPFNTLDFMTELLYNMNPQHPDRGHVPLLEIPFVKSWLKDHPRPPRPRYLSWTGDQAATKIQCAWRGYLVRRDPEVQKLRRWQRDWRVINREGEIHAQVSGFWEKIMPVSSSSSTHSFRPESSTSSRKDMWTSLSQSVSF